jgi:hypothetical protein
MMSCYFRHMKDLLQEAGVEVDQQNKKDIDRAIHDIAGVTYKDCSQTWRKVKEMTGDEAGRKVFVKRLKAVK